MNRQITPAIKENKKPVYDRQNKILGYEKEFIICPDCGSKIELKTGRISVYNYFWCNCGYNKIY